MRAKYIGPGCDQPFVFRSIVFYPDTFRDIPLEERRFVYGNKDLELEDPGTHPSGMTDEQRDKMDDPTLDAGPPVS